MSFSYNHAHSILSSSNNSHGSNFVYLSNVLLVRFTYKISLRIHYLIKHLLFELKNQTPAALRLVQTRIVRPVPLPRAMPQNMPRPFSSARSSVSCKVLYRQTGRFCKGLAILPHLTPGNPGSTLTSIVGVASSSAFSTPPLIRVSKLGAQLVCMSKTYLYSFRISGESTKARNTFSEAGDGPLGNVRL